jgi:hypothetical protein
MMAEDGFSISIRRTRARSFCMPGTREKKDSRNKLPSVASSDLPGSLQLPIRTGYANFGV